MWARSTPSERLLHPPASLVETDQSGPPPSFNRDASHKIVAEFARSTHVSLAATVAAIGASSLAEEAQGSCPSWGQRRLMEIESRLLPCGLHVVGQPPTAAEAIATLVNIAEIDRVDNDPPIAGLPGILARTIRRNVEEIYLNNNKV